MEFKKAVLDNGLTLIAETHPVAASLAIGFFVRTGSRDESPEIAGVSHFLEHMVFKGTPRRTAFQVNYDFDQIGAEYNAFTSEENTVFFGACLPEFQQRLLDVLADILRPSLRQEDFDVEKKVILEEIAVYQDQPKFRVYEKLMQEHFADHPLGHSILGANESISALTRGQMQDYFDRRYSPSNVTLVGVGKLDFDAFVDQARQACSSWRNFEAARETPPAPRRRGRWMIVDPKLTRFHIGMMADAPTSQEEARYAAELAAGILGDDTGSRLFYALVDTAIADDASLVYDSLDEAGAFLTFLSCDPAQARQAIDIAMQEFRRFQQDGPTDEELTAAKNKIASSATVKGELPMGRLREVGSEWVYRREYTPLAQQIRALLDVPKQQVIEVVRRHDVASVSLLVLGPSEVL
jgi:predicted Zn-dependent peptidase